MKDKMSGRVDIPIFGKIAKKVKEEVTRPTIFERFQIYQSRCVSGRGPVA